MIGTDLPAVPDYYGQFLKPLAMQQDMAIQQQQAQQQKTAFSYQLAQAAREQQQAKDYQADAAHVISNPTPEGYQALMLKYPQMHDSLQEAYKGYSDGEKQRDNEAASSVYAALSNDRPDVALDVLTQRKKALESAGQDTSMDDAVIQMLQSGDPAQIQKAKGLAGFVLASQAGPDKIGDVLDSLAGKKGGYTLQQGDYRYDDQGNLIAVGGAAKDDGSAPTPATPAGDTGAKGAISYIIGKNEGGYNPKDANGSPTNFGINYKANAPLLKSMGITPASFKDMTQDQATQVYMQKYWPQSGAGNLPANLQAPYFDVYIRNPGLAKKALAQSDGDPAKFVQISNQMFAPFLAKHPEYTKSYQSRFDNNMAIANGQSSAPILPSDGQPPAPAGFHWLAPQGANGQFHILSDAEAKAHGLDPNQQYQLDSKTGKITGLGQKTGGGVDVLAQYNIAPDETGSTVLAKLPANISSQVKALAEGRLPMPSSYALAKPYWQTMLQLTSQYDPSFDASSYPARKAAITAFTGMGKGAQVIGSVNRVANHLGLLWNESLKLAGPETGVGPINTALAATGQAFEPQDARAYDTEVGFVAGELGKIAKAGVVTEGEVDRIISNLSRKQSASTRASAIKAAVGIISGAVDPLKDQYNSAFTNGSTRPNIPWVSPRAQQIYSKIGGPDGAAVDLSLTGQGAASNNAADGASSVPSKTIGGKTYYNVGGKWFDNPEGR